MIIYLDSNKTLILSILVLFLGKFLLNKINFLSKNSIPEPVVGGAFFAIISLFIYLIFDIEFDFSLEQRDSLLIVFFTTIGLSSRISYLKKGGGAFIKLVILVFVMLIIQDISGVGLASIEGVDKIVGLISGSISLSGGHGTAIAWSKVLISEHQIHNALEIGLACATFGLIIGGVIGGPLANYLIKKNKLKDKKEDLDEAVEERKVNNIVKVDHVLEVLLKITISIFLGVNLKGLLSVFNFILPDFVTCLFCAILITNLLPLVQKNHRKLINLRPSLNLIKNLSLGLFLSMSLMSLKLWTLSDLALNIFLLLLLQVIVGVLFTVFVVFKIMGKDYEAAVISSGFIGMILGATPTAIANMSSVEEKYGSANKAMLIIPLAGAFFMDILNVIVLTFMLNFI